ncbi:MAG TPA: MFS transporter [Virgibacillus sp.]|nr:MFS transporter [Virgibacillus sp.]
MGAQKNNKEMAKIASASFIGSLMEWYDFTLYGTMAALVFDKLFFPSDHHTVGLLLSFATFAVGFLTRPLGGAIFGHFGDRIGRKRLLIITMYIMGGATFLIGIIPTYESIGITAPILLILLRIIQGFGIGGEYGGASLMTIEHAPRNKRGFWGSIPQASNSAGLLVGTGVISLFLLLPDGQFMAWGWRIPFLLSGVLFIIGIIIRRNMDETPAFKEMKEDGDKKDSKKELPIITLFRHYWKSILITLGARFGEGMSSNIFNAFAIAYVTTQLGLSEGMMTTGIFIASAVNIVCIPFFGALSDRIGRKPVYMSGAIFVVLFAFPFFWLLNTQVTGLIYLALILSFVLGPTLMFSVQSVFFTELFGTQVRYSGISLAYQLSSIAGGLTPLIATALLSAGKGDPWLVSLFLVVVGVISIVSIYLASETFKNDVSEQEINRLKKT